jgi:YaiO family outer membrane protein
LVYTAGYTNLTFGSPQSTSIFNSGVLVYVGSTVAEITLFANRNQPGRLWSGAAMAAVQRGQEGRRWYGVSVGGGRELYRMGDRPDAAIADYDTATVSVFLRQWLTPASGVHITMEYQRATDLLQRVAIGGRWFVQF